MKIGRERNIRWNAVAAGPTSLVFTKIGAKLITIAPEIRADNARAGRDDVIYTAGNDFNKFTLFSIAKLCRIP